MTTATFSEDLVNSTSSRSMTEQTTTTGRETEPQGLPSSDGDIDADEPAEAGEGDPVEPDDTPPVLNKESNRPESIHKLATNPNTTSATGYSSDNRAGLHRRGQQTSPSSQSSRPTDSLILWSPTTVISIYALLIAALNVLSRIIQRLGASDRTRETTSDPATNQVSSPPPTAEFTREPLLTPLPIEESSPPPAFRLTRKSIFNKTILVGIVFVFGPACGGLVAKAVQQKRKPECRPSPSTITADDGFWFLLSLVLVQILSIYCTLYPVILSRELKSPIHKALLFFFLGLSFTTAITAAAVYAWNWVAAIILSFVSGFSQVVSAGLLAAGLVPQGGRGRKVD